MGRSRVESPGDWEFFVLIHPKAAWKGSSTAVEPYLNLQIGPLSAQDSVPRSKPFGCGRIGIPENFSGVEARVAEVAEGVNGFGKAQGRRTRMLMLSRP